MNARQRNPIKAGIVVGAIPVLLVYYICKNDACIRNWLLGFAGFGILVLAVIGMNDAPGSRHFAKKLKATDFFIAYIFTIMIALLIATLALLFKYSASH